MTYNEWPEDFPPVTSLVPYTTLRHNDDPEIAELYDRAKNHEDTIAAAELIDKLFINEGAENIRQKIESLSAQNPNAIIAYVHAVEGQGKNQIPTALTKFISEISGLEIDDSIVQANIVSKTGISNSWYRMIHRPSFDGQVESGREYILVDDVFSAGGTFSELRAFIENNGGKVVNAVTMANGSKSMNPQLGVTKGHILELERKYGVESIQQFLKEESLYAGNHKALTDSEARTILGAATLDEARDRIAQARQEGIIKNSRGMVQSSPLPEEVKNPQNTLSDSNSLDSAPSPNLSKTSERLMYPNRRSQTMPETINDYINQNSTIEPDGTLRVKGFAEASRKLNEDKSFFGDIMKFAFEHDRLPTDEEIAKMPKQGEAQGKTASLEAEQNNKEQSMSDEHNGLNWGSENIAGAELGIKDSGRFTYFKVKPSGDGQSVILGFNSEANLANERPVIALKAKGDINSAKLLVEETVKHFTTQKDSGLVDIENYLHDSIEKQQAQKEATSIGVKKNNKEQSMSDEFDPRKQTENDLMNEYKDYAMSEIGQDSISPENTKQAKQEAFQNAYHQRSKIMAALKNGTLSCLPGADGLADTAPARNLETGKVYHGANLLYLKEHQKQLGFPTAEYLTRHQIDEASRDNPNIEIKLGDPSVKLQVSEFNEETKQWENKKIELYNIAQTTDPKGLKDWVAAKEQQKEEKMQNQFPESYKPREPKQKEKGPEITCRSTEPEKYLGQYFAAVSMGGTFKVSPEQAKEFAAKFENALNQKMANGHPNPFNLAKITNAASKECVELMKGIGKTGTKYDREFEKKLERQQKREQQHRRGMSL